MKKIKKIMCTVTATIMAMFAVIMPTTVSAEGTVTETEAVIDLSTANAVEVLENGDIVYDVELPSAILPPGDEINSSLTQSLQMNSLAESVRKAYYGNRIQYTVKATKSNGSASTNIISAQLWDTVHTSSLTDTRITANGSTVTISDITITSGRTYFMRFVLTSGSSSTTLKVSVSVQSYTVSTY